MGLSGHIFDSSGTSYFYLRNLQGDVVSIADKSGDLVVNYIYDAWGQVTASNPSMIWGAPIHPVGHANPIRYRGYYYDTETGYYWLQTRYYSPEWKRFINADALFIAGNPLTASNMYAYCDGNPVMYVDPSGMNAVVRAAWKAAFNGNILPKEEALINAYPIQASMAIMFAGMAMIAALVNYGGGTGKNDDTKGNAFMHAHWSFMMTVFLGVDMAMKFSAAHENQDPEIYNNLKWTADANGRITSVSYPVVGLSGHSSKQAQMDLFNNFMGIVAGITYSIFAPKCVFIQCTVIYLIALTLRD